MIQENEEELPLTPGFMKSSIRPDRADKIRKMFSARKSIPIVPSPKKDSRQEILKIINRRPDSIVQRQHEAQGCVLYSIVTENTVISFPCSVWGLHDIREIEFEPI